MAEHTVKMVIDRRGRGLVEVDGVDISTIVESAVIRADSLSRPQIELVMIPGLIDLTVVGDVKAVADLLIEPEATDGGA